MQRPSGEDGVSPGRARVVVRRADVLTSPTHRHSVAWLSLQKDGCGQAPNRVHDRSGTMQHRASSWLLQRLKGRLRVEQRGN